MDVLSGEIEPGYSQEFMNQMGMIKYFKVGKVQDGIEEMQFFFKDVESLENYLEEFDLYDQASIVL